MTVQDLYERQVKQLKAPERLRLATMILNDLSPSDMVDDSDEWTDEDLRDFAAAGWRRSEEAAGDDADA